MDSPILWSLAERVHARAIALATAHGWYRTAEALDAARNWIDVHGYCIHGLAPSRCPAGCGDTGDRFEPLYAIHGADEAGGGGAPPEREGHEDDS